MISAAQPVINAVQKTIQRQAPVIAKYAVKGAISTAKTAAGVAATIVALDFGWNISKRIRDSKAYKRITGGDKIQDPNPLASAIKEMEKELDELQKKSVSPEPAVTVAATSMEEVVTDSGSSITRKLSELFKLPELIVKKS